VSALLTEAESPIENSWSGSAWSDCWRAGATPIFWWF